MVTREGGAQAGEYLAKYGADRVRTVSTTWLGSTMGCCECHDHKFDPFSTRDFYSLKAFFADIKQWGIYSDYGYTPNPDLKGYGNDHPFPPEITVESPYLLKRMERIEDRMAALATAAVEKLPAIPASPVSYEQWHQRSLEFLQQWPSGWALPTPRVAFTSAKTNATAETAITIKADSSILFTEKTTNEVEVTLSLPPGWLAAIRLELLPCAEPDGRIPMAARGTTITLSAALKSPDNDKEAALPFYHGDADYKQDRYDNGSTVIGLRNSWTPSRAYDQSPQTAVWLMDPPRAVKPGDVLTVRLGKGLAGCLRLSVSPFAAPDPLKSGGAFTRALSIGRHSPMQQVFLLGTAADSEAFAEYKKIHREWLECRGGKSPTVVTEAWKPAVTKVLARGNWQDENGEIVQPAVPHFLPQVPNPDGRRLTRLDLARWLVSRDNPLTVRTEVNRLWKQFFGAGLAPVLDDLGAQGEWPVHPELLDWLAVEFRDNGWDVKQIVKTMVMSATYRQSSNPSPALHELDPANRRLASQSPRRLEAEFVRDNALFIAGLLNEDLGGPSAHPYQPAGYYANIQFPDRDYQPELDDRQYRRGLYAHWQRTFLQPMLVAFDAPAREECTAIRNLSNSPQQALALLNDPTFVEAARVFAAKVLSSPGDDALHLDLIYERALARPIKPGERKSLARFLAMQREYYQAHAGDARKLMGVGTAGAPKGLEKTEVAAWTQVCRVVLDLHETITKY